MDTYLTSIQEAIKSDEPLDTIQYKIVWEALANCTEKFKSRIIKCKKAAEVYTETEEVNRESKSLSGFSPDWNGQTDVQTISSFAKEIQQYETSLAGLKADIQELVLLSRKACIIGTVLQFSSDL